MQKSFKMGVLATLLTVTAFTTSCYGPFQLTRNFYNWNGTVTQNKWGREGIFLAFNIIPVYGICMLGDALIFNSIVFWGGDNPIHPSAMATTDNSMDSVAAAYGLNCSVSSMVVHPSR